MPCGSALTAASQIPDSIRNPSPFTLALYDVDFLFQRCLSIVRSWGILVTKGPCVENPRPRKPLARPPDLSWSYIDWQPPLEHACRRPRGSKTCEQQCYQYYQRPLLGDTATLLWRCSKSRGASSSRSHNGIGCALVTQTLGLKGMTAVADPGRIVHGAAAVHSNRESLFFSTCRTLLRRGREHVFFALRVRLRLTSSSTMLLTLTQTHSEVSAFRRGWWPDQSIDTMRG